MQNKDLAREVVQESTQKPARELCWLLGTSVLKIGILSTIDQASLPKNVRYDYNQ